MKNIVISDEYNEIDLKPSELLDEYMALTEKGIKEYLNCTDKSLDQKCPACNSAKSEDKFEKLGMKYVGCLECGTLYTSVRPKDEDLDKYYTESEARIFWRDKLSEVTRDKREEKIIKPRLQWILESTAEYFPEAEVLADINTTQPGYVEGIAGSDVFDRCIMIKPLICPESAEIATFSDWDSSLNEKVDVVSLFEVLNRTSDVDAVFRNIKNILRPGGLCFVTSILASGFDFLVLGENANNLYPPDRLNMFSVEGLKALFDKHGLECLEFSTPGILDLENVSRALKEDPDMEISRFVKYFINNRDEDSKIYFQQFLQANLLSSYGRILLRNK